MLKIEAFLSEAEASADGTRTVFPQFVTVYLAVPEFFIFINVIPVVHFKKRIQWWLVAFTYARCLREWRMNACFRWINRKKLLLFYDIGTGELKNVTKGKYFGPCVRENHRKSARKNAGVFCR